MKYLFAYGTLQFSDIQKKVIGKELKQVTEDAVALSGYNLSQVVIEGLVFNCIVPYDNYGIPVPKILGNIYEVGEEDLTTLDIFEGDDYKRVTEKVYGLEVEVYIKA